MVYCVDFYNRSVKEKETLEVKEIPITYFAEFTKTILIQWQRIFQSFWLECRN